VVLQQRGVSAIPINTYLRCVNAYLKWANALVIQVNRVNDAVQDPFLLPVGAYVAGVSGVAALYFVMSEYTQSLELRPFDELYGVAFAGIVLLLLTCARVVFVWTRLHRLLCSGPSSSTQSERPSEPCRW
jgi:hypothetical protein